MEPAEIIRTPPGELHGDIKTVNRQLRARFSAYSETPDLDSKVLLSHILQRPKSWVIAHPEYPIEPQEMSSLSEAVGRLDQGEPLPYVLGAWEFYGLTFRVTPHVLIPRPETELLVEAATNWLQRHPEKRLAADVGTGSGCIAVALAKFIPDLQLIASDISFASLGIAQENIDHHRVSKQIYLIQTDLLTPLCVDVDLICANLPYIPSRKLNSLRVSEQEPALALDGGLDGLAVIDRLLENSRYILNPGGLLLLEIEARQGKQAFDSAMRNFPRANLRLIKDLAGFDRILVAEIPD